MSTALFTDPFLAAGDQHMPVGLLALVGGSFEIERGLEDLHVELIDRVIVGLDLRLRSSSRSGDAALVILSAREAPVAEDLRLVMTLIQLAQPDRRNVRACPSELQHSSRSNDIQLVRFRSTGASGIVVEVADIRTRLFLGTSASEKEVGVGTAAARAGESIALPGAAADGCGYLAAMRRSAASIAVERSLRSRS